MTPLDKIQKSSGKNRAYALIRKESRQMIRDKSTLTLGIFLPMVLLLLFGFGLSLDVKDVPVVIVRDSTSPISHDLFVSLKLSPYFTPVMADSWHEAEELLKKGEIQAILRRDIKDRSDYSEHIQVLTNGRDSNQARIMERYLEGAISQWAESRSKNIMPQSLEPVGMAMAETRVWYNHAMESRYFLIPGVTALIMTLIGSLLTALVVAREWERGTYEAMAATPVKRFEIILGKTVPYFGLGMVGLSLCLLAAAFIFRVPMRGSLLTIILGSSLYLILSLGLGLFVSAAVKNQFLSSQIVLIFSFFPTIMLSGFVFDLHSAPLIIYYIGYMFPATWYVDLLQTLFLVGDVPEIIIKDFLVLAFYGLFMLGLATNRIKKQLE